MCSILFFVIKTSYLWRIVLLALKYYIKTSGKQGLGPWFPPVLSSVIMLGAHRGSCMVIGTRVQYLCLYNNVCFVSVILGNGYLSLFFDVGQNSKVLKHALGAYQQAVSITATSNVCYYC